MRSEKHLEKTKSGLWGDVPLHLGLDSAPPGTADTWGQMILCRGGCSGYCGMFVAASPASIHQMPLAAAPSPSLGVCKTSPLANHRCGTRCPVPLSLGFLLETPVL